MELVFLYVNKSNNEYISKQGFNFSPNIVFEVEYINEVYVLSSKDTDNKIPKGFFGDKECVQNVTAVVGENGSGKTTLLNEIMSIRGSVKDTDHDEAYNAYFESEYENDKKIAIFYENEELVCYHNIDNLKINADVNEVYLYQGSEELQKMLCNNTGIASVSKIYLSNSIYSIAWDGVSTDGNIDEVYLNVNSVKTLKKIFYQNKCRNITSCFGGYAQYQDIIIDNRTNENFQQLLDVIYMRYLSDNKLESIVTKNIKRDLLVRFNIYTKVLQNYFGNFDSDDNREQPLIKHHQLTKRILNQFNVELIKNDIFIVLYFNLLYELIVYKRMEAVNDEVSIADKNGLIDYIDILLKNLEMDEDEYAYYFIEAYEEICEFEELMSQCEQEICLLPVSDMGYLKRLILKYNTDLYIKFEKLIMKSVFSRKYSFIVKYIEIGGLELASGERALINFFSWIHFVQSFKEISNDVTYSLKKNILLLIDEIDLYCHPLWQQKILSYLLKEIEIQFPQNKVQIIFTTHSPIVLSDVPKCNVIYLKKRDEYQNCEVDDMEIHEETFGANIYKLFDDSFFLGKRGQIGEFAKEKIQEIINCIKPHIVDNKLKYPQIDKEKAISLKEEILLIGDSLIREKLYTMLLKCQDKQENVRDKKIRMYEEKLKLLKNGEL